ncbi:cupin domain-containing protein [Arthrobacter tumbae]|uniref:cupin domain-containing protein n=1 Tax=Arthrobacter tumbae TaxID=163874 RepID=UPI0019582DA3|nr:cupin domain-containing protein [Arthrobacter tumbae]MBM7781120.1 mannose-6-phosphate isomerase-like protein (cupin superfamily) [Arthrobacter tumbae]
MSDLRVYEWATADGHHGGTPHLHTVSNEGYVVIGGSGEVHTLSSEGYARDPLSAGSVLWFSPGTVHRLINTGDLHILTIMQNSGLPEAGDAVLTFPLEIVSDAGRYRSAVTLPEGSEAERGEAARRRRDLAIEGYADLLAALESGDRGPLEAFYVAAAALVQPRVEEWTKLWTDTVLADVETTRAQLTSLAEGDASHLGGAAVVRAVPRPEPRAFGMCGRLGIWDADRRS